MPVVLRYQLFIFHQRFCSGGAEHMYMLSGFLFFYGYHCMYDIISVPCGFCGGEISISNSCLADAKSALRKEAKSS